MSPPRSLRMIAASILASVSLCPVVLLPGAAESFEVGYTSITFLDPERGNRQVPVSIYYPADSTGTDVPVATPPEGGFPIVSFGHGYLAGWDEYAFVWEGLVPEGYVVVLPRTGGELLPNHLEFGLDLAFAARALRAEGSEPSSVFHGALSEAAAVGGHSMGGGASFLGTASDTTVAALFNLAAAETNPSAIAAAGEIAVPALLFSGSLDCVTPPAGHQIPMYEALASGCKTHVMLMGGSHCQFAESNFICSLGETACPTPTITRTEQQDLTLALLVPWLAGILYDDPQAWEDFQDLLAGLSGIECVQDCPVSAVVENGPPVDVRDTGLGVESYPNPFSDETQIRFRTDYGASVTVDVYAVTGRRVRSLVDGTMSPGWHGVAWDGRDDGGQALPSGVYLYRVRHARGILTGRVVLAR